MLFSAIGMLLTVYPGFLILKEPTLINILTVQILFSFILGGINGVIFVFLGDLFVQKNCHPALYSMFSVAGWNSSVL
jgi:hypothetical protein